jgi:hypothetical protein
MVLRSVVLSVIHTIRLVPFFQVTPVRAFFAVIPVVIVLVVAVVDSELNCDALRRRSGHNSHRRRKDRGQQ